MTNFDRKRPKNDEFRLEMSQKYQISIKPRGSYRTLIEIASKESNFDRNLFKQRRISMKKASNRLNSLNVTSRNYNDVQND